MPEGTRHRRASYHTHSTRIRGTALIFGTPAFRVFSDFLGRRVSKLFGKSMWRPPRDRYPSRVQHVVVVIYLRSTRSRAITICARVPSSVVSKCRTPKGCSTKTTTRKSMTRCGGTSSCVRTPHGKRRVRPYDYNKNSPSNNNNNYRRR